MPRQRSLRAYDDLRPDSPLRLADACEIIFYGQLTPAALRREAARGNLVLEKIAGKDFVTLAAIEAMRERCQWTGQSDRSVPPEDRRTDERAARKAKLAKLKAQYLPVLR